MKSPFNLEIIIGLGKSIGNSVLEHKNSLATGLAAFALPFIFTNKA